MKLNFRNRIALYYIVVTAVIILGTFISIYLLVRNTIYESIDADLQFEIQKHSQEITIGQDTIYFTNKAELEEREHLEVQVNPVFIQITDTLGQVFDKSPNLKEDILQLVATGENSYFNSELSHKSVRQAQLPLTKNGKVKGYMIGALSINSALTLLSKLKYTLLILYPLILIVLFLISRYLAGKNISPIANIIHTTNRITRNNLHERVQLPETEDELYALSSAINELLGRVQAAMDREKAFTMDASHELRTPLTNLRGNLEVLIRKERATSEYEKTVNYSLDVIDSMTHTLEQLLILARMDKAHLVENDEGILITSVIDICLARQKWFIEQKNIQVKLEYDALEHSLIPEYYSQLIVDNILGNAIKYSAEAGLVEIAVQEIDGLIHCVIKDHGVGIAEEDFDHLYQSFYRAKDSSGAPGNGLGLSIVKKAAEEIGARLEMKSTKGKGTVVTIIFKPILRE